MKRSEQNLLQLAHEQLGLFTAKQANRVGFHSSNHSYYVRVGDWVREYRGIFRFSSFPPSSYDQMMVFYLWSLGTTLKGSCYYSYETALSVHELSDVNPPKLHLSVPVSFRRVVIPEILILHRGPKRGKEIQDFYGMKITTPAQTIMDIVRDKKLDPSLIREAIKEANRKGLLLKKHFLGCPGIKKFL